MPDQTVHMSEGDTLEPDRDSWYRAKCTCGWVWGAARKRGRGEPLPGPMEVIDVLMEHAFDMGRAARAQKKGFRQ